MTLFSRSKRIVNIAVDDYAIRLTENKGDSLSTVKLLEEKELPAGLIKNGKILDEMEFYRFMKELVHDLRLRHRNVRFYVPSSLVIMRHVHYPKHIQGNDLREHFLMEFGKSIHLPFQNPLFDVYMDNCSQEDSENETRSGVLFAAPEEEVNKYSSIFGDASLKPDTIDVKSLGVYRFFHHVHHAKQERVYLFYEFNLTSNHLSIFHHHIPEFIRHQQLDIDTGNWKADTTYSKKIEWVYKGNEDVLDGLIKDQINELDRILDFYRYSMHKGEKKVDEIIVLGDFPSLPAIVQTMKQEYEIPVTLLTGSFSKTKEEQVDMRFIPVLGLALRGGEKGAS